ncbi:hypothetical protein PANT111_40211 [Pantoea brenneri]|uniref:Uncharacterized protein n=1 Tax=Pantoea brenneri TaxID=472694 RepID=A0AAX3JAQ3_9GAMM|nr:hypothetical protein PANT111_40211 [Pantoea brenneri]
MAEADIPFTNIYLPVYKHTFPVSKHFYPVYKHVFPVYKHQIASAGLIWQGINGSWIF